MSSKTRAKTLESVAAELCVDELTDYLVYSNLARIEPEPRRRRILEALAIQEKRHYEFWRSLASRDCKPRKVNVTLLSIAYRLLGPAFILKLLERGEDEAIRRYRSVLEEAPEELKPEIERIIREEEEHEKILMGEVKDSRVQYLGYAALGLADAIVEITGVHAGFLGATENTIVAGVAGLIVGFAAAISMASAAYIQAKHGEEESPVLSALVTGLSYIVSVVLLALPYFLIHVMALSFAVSTLIGIGLSGALTYYASVVQEKPFAREFLETTGLILLTAVASYAFGELVNRVFGIREVLG